MIKGVTNKMACLICYVSNDDLIDLMEEEAKQHQIASVLLKFFSFCFSDEPKCGHVCRKCWCNVDVFNQFYVQIEEIQGNYFKSENFEPSKYFESLDNVQQDEDSSLYENSAEDGFDSISIGSDHIKVDGNDDSENDDIENVDIEKDIKAEIVNKIESKEKQVKPAKPVKRKRGRPRTRDYTQKQTKKSIRCKLCQETFPTNTKLRAHHKKRHPEYSFWCLRVQCFEIFTTAEFLEQHKATHSSKIPCEQCGKMIQSYNMAKHIGQIHGIDQKIICDLCGRVSSSIQMHRYHVRSDHEVHERLQCDICKEWYKNKENLRLHMKSIHVEGPKTCDICGRISTNTKALAKHKKIHLEGSKERFKCVVCGKGFRDRTKLKEHSYIHSGITDAYECQFCGKAFRFGSSMYAHRTKYHPTEMANAKDRRFKD